MLCCSNIPKMKTIKQWLSEYAKGTDPSSSSQMQSRESPSDSTGVLLNTALLTRIEFLEAENDRLKASLSKPQYFRIEQVQHDDHLFRFYTGFTSFAICLSFWDLLFTN